MGAKGFFGFKICDAHVVGFQIPMDNPVFVGVPNPIEQALEHQASQVPGQTTGVIRNESRQGSPRDVFHYQRKLVTQFQYIVENDHIVVVRCFRQSPRFSCQGFQIALASTGSDDLDGHFAFSYAIGHSLPNLTHAANADLGNEAVFI